VGVGCAARPCAVRYAPGVAVGEWSRRVAANIRAECARIGVTDKWMAQQLGISPSSWSERVRAAGPLVGLDVDEVGRVAEILAEQSGEDVEQIRRRLLHT